MRLGEKVFDSGWHSRGHGKIDPVLGMLAVLILTGTSLVSCSDNAVLTAIKQEVAGSSAAAKHAYIAGRVGNSTNGQIPVYWKDGVINYLQLSPTYTNGWTCGITVDKSGNVYVQGGQWNTTSTIYGYWKGSIFTQLSTGGYAYLWEQNIAVDTTGNVWLAYDVSNSGTYPPTIPAYWENSGSPTLLPSATNVWDVIADGSGNVYFFGTTGGTSDNAASPDYSQTPAVWKNGTSLTSLAVTAGGGYTYGDAGGGASDASGNLYAFGGEWTPNNTAPIYWKAVNGTWGSANLLNEGSYSGNWFGGANGIAVDSAGNVDALDTTAPSSQSQTNGYFNSGTLVYWKGASSAPAALPLLNGYTYWKVYSGAVDVNGNYFVAGSLANSATEANNLTGIPVYWENGGGPIQLPLGSNGGVFNTYGSAWCIATGP
jgi:hypothetical protein